MESATEAVDWEARAQAAEAEAKKFEGKYRGLRRRIVEVGSEIARKNSWCGVFDETIAAIDPLFKRIEPPTLDYRVTVVVSFTFQGMEEAPSQRAMLRAVNNWSHQWDRCLDGRVWDPGSIALTMAASAEKIEQKAGEEYNPELDADDLLALGLPVPVVPSDDDDDDDEGF